MGLSVGLARRRDGPGGVGDAEFFADLLDFSLRAAVGGVAGAVEGAHFLRNVVAVRGDIVGDGDELCEETPGCDTEEAGKDEDHGHGGDGAWNAKAFDAGDNRGEQEGEEDGESQGEQENFGEIENRDGQNRDGNEPELREKACGGRGIHSSLRRQVLLRVRCGEMV